MNFITPETKANHIAVIDATNGRDLIAIVPEVKRLLLSPEFSSVVICRHSQTLTETYARASAQMQGANYKVFSSDNKLVSFLKYYWQYVSKGYRFHAFRETLGELKDYGPDFVNFTHLLEKCGKSKVDVRKSTDDSFHVDYESELSLLKGFLPFSVVATMSLNEAGTQIADYGRDFFNFDNGWDFDETKIQEEKILIVQDGDIVFMRANDSSYLAPCIHRAPPHEYNRTKDRIVGIAELLPY